MITPYAPTQGLRSSAKATALLLALLVFAFAISNKTKAQIADVPIDPIEETVFVESSAYARSDVVSAIVASTSLSVTESIPLAMAQENAQTTNALLKQILVQLRILNQKIK